MAGRIAGITIEIGGDTSNLQKSLKGVDSQLKTTQANLKDINKLLKLNPGNVDLLRQKQQELKNAISQTKDRLKQLKEAQTQYVKGSDEWNRIQREIIETEGNLKDLQKQYREFGNVAGQKLQAVGQSLQDAGQKVEDFGRKLQPISTAAAAIGGALLKLGYDAVTGADDLNTLAKQTGFSTAELQKMQYAADLVDVSVEDMTGALKKLKPKITEDNESLKDLGVSVTDADGNMRDATDVFYDVIEALSKIDNETERDQKAMDIFGKSADSLAGIIDDGGKALKEYGKQAEDLGLIIGQDMLDELNDANDEIDKIKGELKGTFKVLGATVARQLAPALKKAGQWIGKLTDKLKKLTPEQTETILKIVGITAAIAPAIIAVGKVIKVVGSTISIFGKLVSSFGLVGIAIMAAIAIGVLLWKNWDKIKKFAEDLRKKVVTSFNNLKTQVSTSVNALKTSVTTTWTNLKTSVTTTVNNLKTAVSNAWTGLKTKVTTTVTNLKTAVVNAWTNIKTSVSTAVTNLKSAVSTAWDNIKSKVSDVVDKVKPIVQAITDKFDALRSKGDDMKIAITGAWDSVKNKIDKVKESIKSSVDGVSEKFKTLVDWLKAAVDWLSRYRQAEEDTPVAYQGNSRNVMGNAAKSVNNQVTINVYTQKGQSAKEIAYEVQNILVAQTIQRNRAYA